MPPKARNDEGSICLRRGTCDDIRRVSIESFNSDVARSEELGQLFLHRLDLRLTMCSNRVSGKLKIDFRRNDGKWRRDSEDPPCVAACGEEGARAKRRIRLFTSIGCHDHG